MRTARRAVVLVAMVIVYLVLVVCIDHAAEVVCDPPGNSKAPCLPIASYTFHSAASPDPFDAPVTFGGEEVIHGRIFWRWIKAGEPSKPCTAVQRNEQGGSYARGCAAKVGDVLFITSAFRVVP